MTCIYMNHDDRRALFASLISDKATIVSFHLQNNAKNISEMNGRAPGTWPHPIATLLAMHFFTHSPPLLHRF